MEKTEFFNVHKDFAQEGPIYGHEQFLGLSKDQAMSKYHQLLASAYAASDPWTHVFITRDDGVSVSGETIDRRVAPSPVYGVSPEQGGS